MIDLPWRDGLKTMDIRKMADFQCKSEPLLRQLLPLPIYVLLALGSYEVCKILFF
jgi:hypothetical protein